MLIAAGVHPVGPRLELRGVARPVREMELVRTEQPRRTSAEVRQGPAPGLHGPVGPVRCLAPGDEERELRPRVRPARAARTRPTPPGVVLPELHLRDTRVRVPRIDGARSDDAVETPVRAV